MIDGEPHGRVPALKDAARERPIPSAWRTAFCDIVKSFVRQDYRLNSGVSGVAPVPLATAEHI